MPSRGPSICACGALVPAGSTCPCRAKAKADTARQYDAERGNATARGYDWTWRRLRDQHLAESPLCIMCLAEDVVEVAMDVDHVTPISVAPEGRLDRSNLQSLCRRHHNEKTAAETGGGRRL